MYLFTPITENSKLHPNFLSTLKDHSKDVREVKLTSLEVLVIIGRGGNLTIGQKRAFEILKRKYKNIINILTYGKLLRCLKRNFLPGTHFYILLCQFERQTESMPPQI